MAFEKIVDSPNILSFYYPVDDLLDLVSLWTLYKSSDMLDADGQALIEKMALTIDEKDIFLNQLSDGVFDILNRFLKYTTGITNAIRFNESYTPSGGSAADSVVLQIIDHEQYNENYPKSVDKIIEKTLKFYVLSEWFALKNLDNDAKKASAMYRESIAQMLHHSVQLKKVAITF